LNAGTPDLSPEATARRDALVERLFQATLGAWDVLGVYLGDRLGLYRGLAERGRLTSGELAAATGTHERYAREWLEQQAAGGILEVDDAAAPAQARRYSLPPGHEEALLHESSLNTHHRFRPTRLRASSRDRGAGPAWLHLCETRGAAGALHDG
jgi:hypothetical protein